MNYSGCGFAGSRGLEEDGHCGSISLEVGLRWKSILRPYVQVPCSYIRALRPQGDSVGVLWCILPIIDGTGREDGKCPPGERLLSAECCFGDEASVEMDYSMRGLIL